LKLPAHCRRAANKRATNPRRTLTSGGRAAPHQITPFFQTYRPPISSETVDSYALPPDLFPEKALSAPGLLPQILYRWRRFRSNARRWSGGPGNHIFAVINCGLYLPKRSNGRSAADVYLLDQEYYAGLDWTPGQDSRLKRALTQRPLQVSDYTWIIRLFQNLDDLAPAIGADLDQRPRSFIARLAVSNIAEAYQRAVMHYPWQFVSMLASAIRVLQRYVVVEMIFLVTAPDHRVFLTGQRGNRNLDHPVRPESRKRQAEQDP